MTSITLRPDPPASRRLHERRDHAALAVLLGVPEDAEGERLVRDLDRLDHVPSPTAQPRGDEALAEPPDSLVMVRLAPTCRSAPPPAPPASPGSSRTSWSPNAARRVAMVVSSRRGGAGRASRRRRRSGAPCPRQMPSTGIPRPGRARTSASSKRSRSGQVRRGLRVRARRRSVRVDVGAAGEQQGVEPVEQRLGSR